MAPTATSLSSSSKPSSARRSTCRCVPSPFESRESYELNAQVWLGVYMDSDPTVYDRQIATTLDILREYGADHVSGVTVRNDLPYAA